MDRVLEFVGSVFRDAISLILLGLGITFAPHMYIGGLFLALAGAAVARAWEKDLAIKAGTPLPREGNLKLTLVILTAFFVSTLTATTVHAFWPNWSVQLVMAASGFASRWIVALAIHTLIGLSGKGGTLADRLVNKYFPEEKDKKNG